MEDKLERFFLWFWTIFFIVYIALCFIRPQFFSSCDPYDEACNRGAAR